MEAGQATLIATDELGGCAHGELPSPPQLLCFDEADRGLAKIATEKAVLVAQQPVTDAQGRPYYDVWAVQKVASDLVGPFVWAPISPLSRRNMEDARLPFPVLPEDWTNVLFVEDWTCARARWVGPRPVIGRHSRPEREKWPATREAVLQVYPARREFDVRLLGAGRPLEVAHGHPAAAQLEAARFREGRAA